MKQKVGEKVKELRRLKDLTLDALAERAGLTVTQIERIEADEILPSLAPLIKIARVLGVRLGTFLDDEERISPTVTRQNALTEALSFSNNNEQARAQMNFFSLAANKAGRHMEPFIVNIKADRSKEFTSSSHEGEEFLYVLEGEVEIDYGKEKFVLSKGDSIYYDSIVKHHVHALGSADASILAVVFAPF
jgi:transcriptional regulator with XRE-family HTH domain